MTPPRIAFLTPEHPAVCSCQGGGLASYLLRITAALRAAGCEVEVFTCHDQSRTIEQDGVRIESCPPADNLALKLLAAHWRSRVALSGSLNQLRAALGLARALTRRQAEAHFDLVQSSDWGLTGYFVKPEPNRIHMQRCSWSRQLCRIASGQKATFDFKALTHLDRVCARRADIAYAPSQFIADHLSRQYRTPIRVLRPPTISASHALKSSDLSRDEPPYLLHFGLMSPLKGTDLVVNALSKALQDEPAIRLRLVGREHQPGYVNELIHALLIEKDRIDWVGPVDRSRMASILRASRAAILPSRADNLPNTVIEALAAGVPVVGTDGASIDELVEHEMTGLLIPMNDIDQLASAMIRVWRNPWRVSASALRNHPTWSAMDPRTAAENLLHLAGIAAPAQRLAA